MRYHGVANRGYRLFLLIGADFHAAGAVKARISLPISIQAIACRFQPTRATSGAAAQPTATLQAASINGLETTKQASSEPYFGDLSGERNGDGKHCSDSRLHLQTSTPCPMRP